MFLKKLYLQNVGPLEEINIDLNFDSNDKPKPLILIGKNGSGKSLVLSFIVNSLISARQMFYDDLEVEKGHVYKLMSPGYINSRKNFYYGRLEFEKNFASVEWQLPFSKQEFEEVNKFTPANKDWKKISKDSSSFFSLIENDNTIHQGVLAPTNLNLKKLVDENTMLFFPANRFEEPGWLNYDDLINRAKYSFAKNYSSVSGRKIINYCPLRENQNWLLDIIFDKKVLEIVPMQKVTFDATTNTNNVTTFLTEEGPCSILYLEIINVLKMLFETEDELRFGVGGRRSRRISILKNESAWIPSIFNLSLGESMLLNIFLTILRDFDLSRTNFATLSDIRGIVVIDEVDIHLHSNLQYRVLPRMIKLFPNVQFILTSHSPLFLLGLKNELGDGNFKVIDVPDGKEVNVEEFSEFETAYNIFKETRKHNEEIDREVKASHKNIIFVEGDYDIKYINKFAELNNKKELLGKFKLIDSNGYGGIDKVKKHFDSKLAKALHQKVILLYDCDMKRVDKIERELKVKVVPTITENPIQIGIENLFKKSSIERAIEFKEDFINVYSEQSNKIRGEIVSIPEKWEVNKNEKGNLCDWFCENGTKDDFEKFNVIFEFLENV